MRRGGSQRGDGEVARPGRRPFSVFTTTAGPVIVTPRLAVSLTSPFGALKIASLGAFQGIRKPNHRRKEGPASRLAQLSFWISQFVLLVFVGSHRLRPRVETWCGCTSRHLRTRRRAGSRGALSYSSLMCRKAPREAGSIESVMPSLCHRAVGPCGSGSPTVLVKWSRRS